MTAVMVEDDAPLFDLPDPVPAEPVDEGWSKQKGQCPHCNHVKGKHRKGVGCEQGWRYDETGAAVQTGCICTSTWPEPMRVEAPSW